MKLLLTKLFRRIGRLLMPWKVKKYFLTLASMFQTNIREYGMFIALIVIFITFGFLSGWVFLGPINFTNLLNQTAYVSVLAVGMTLVIVIRHIDLSVGFIGAYLGAYVVVGVVNLGQPIWFALAGALLITVVVGVIKGVLVAKIKVPAFVVTLAGMFIFKGLLLFKTDNGTIAAANPFFKKLGAGYLPTLEVAGFDIITIILGVLITLGLVFNGVRTRAKNRQLNIPNEKIELFITKLILLIAVIGYLVYSFSSYRGISYLLLVTAVVVAIYHFMTTKTTLGRRIYAVGGNPDAAELSGISVERITIFIFVSMGILALISGVMFVSRLVTASPNYGPFWELYAIAAAFIGGTSAAGGVGKVVNSVVGSVVIMSLKNGMPLASIDANLEPVILGGVLLLAVIFDIFTRNVLPIDYVGIHYAKKKYGVQLKEAKIAFNEAKLDLLNAKKTNVEDLIEYEYRYTNAQGALNKIKDLIRNSKEEDFVTE